MGSPTIFVVLDACRFAVGAPEVVREQERDAYLGAGGIAARPRRYPAGQPRLLAAEGLCVRL